MDKLNPLPKGLTEWARRIEETMISQYGLLDLFGHPIEQDGKPREFGFKWDPVMFQLCNWETLSEVAAYDGFPERYRHYRFGQAYIRYLNQDKYNLGKTFELVINSNPVRAYLLDENPLYIQKLVMAHVFAHADFFKNNAGFKLTNNDMVEVMSYHKRRIDDIISSEGFDTVVNWIDTCLCLENLIDRYREPRNVFLEEKRAGEEPFDRNIRLNPVPEGLEDMENIINPPWEIKRKKEAKEQEIKERKRKEMGYITVKVPSKDVMGFLIAYAPLENWQREILSIVREESLYFAPQTMTQIMNEGWAQYWHEHFMEEEFAEVSEKIMLANLNANCTAMHGNRINPYRLGSRIFKDIKERWDSGRHGEAYDQCDDRIKKREWDTNEQDGLRKLFAVRETYRDDTFLQDFLTPEIVEAELIYNYDREPRSGRLVISDRDVENIRTRLIASRANAGQPNIYVVDTMETGNLVIWHDHTGEDIKLDWLPHCLKSLRRIWKNEVNLITVMDGAPMVYTCDKEGEFNSKEYAVKGHWPPPYRQTDPSLLKGYEEKE